MIVSAEEVVRGLTPIFLCCKSAIVIKIGLLGEGSRYHGQTCGAQVLVVGCVFANLLGMEYEQYYIQKCLDIT
jgi:hypothetical protein